MKKLIDIPDDIVIDLKVQAAKKNQDLKNWIESQLREIAGSTKIVNPQKPKNQ